MTKIYFVRHAEPNHEWEDDRTRPLTEEGEQDSKQVLEILRDKAIDTVYCSPHKRSIDTINETAEYLKKEIIIDERLREREKGVGSNTWELMRKRWADLDYHEENGESISMVQKRNMEALNEIIANNKGKNVVIGTHGTALSSILRFFNENYNCDSFLRIIDWMPYIIELEFDENGIKNQTEHYHLWKEFKK